MCASTFGLFADILLPLLREELRAAAPDSQLAQSTMTTSILHHNLYPSGGSGGQHTDYGLLAAISANAAGLEVWHGGSWQVVSWDSYFGTDYVAVAGDMMERLTSGAVPATPHRVSLPGSGAAAGNFQPVRQSGAFFVQPSPGLDVP